MDRRHVVSLALAVVMLGAILPGPAAAQAPGQGAAKWWNPETQNSRPGWIGHAEFEGRWVAQGGSGSRGGSTLPNILRIDQERRVVRIADARNHVVQVIAIDRGFRTQNHRPAVLSGELRGSRLVATGLDARGRQMKQTMLLRNGGRTLIVRTEVERPNSGRTFEVEKIYQRA